MADEKIIEHHWHDPSQGQVHRAMYQYLTDQGITEKTLSDIVDKKIQAAVYNRVVAWIDSKKFDELILAAVVSFVKTEKANFERNGYGIHNRIRNLIEEQLKELLVKEFQISVTPKGS